MSEPTTCQLFHSEEHAFDPILYVQAGYGGPNPDNYVAEILGWIMDTVHKVFTDGKYRGKNLLDIGSGPVVMPVITASKWFDNIYLSDLSKDNVAFLQKWIEGESEINEAMKYLMSVFAQKDGKGVSWEVKNKQVQQKVKDAIQWNMHKPEMLKGTAIDGVLFDLVTSCQSMCAASTTIAGYVEVVKNISNILKPGGHFVVVDLLDETYYCVNDVKFNVLSTTAEEIKTTFKECGFDIELFQTHVVTSYRPESAPCDAKTIYCVVGKKL